MSADSRSIVPTDQCGLVASVSRQITITEKVLAKIPVGGVLSSANAVVPKLAVQFVSGISAAAISSDGKYILTVSEVENSICLWDVETESILRVFAHNIADPYGIKCLKFQSDGTSAVTEYFDGSIGILDLPTGICHWQPPQPIIATEWPDDQTIVASHDNILVHSPNTGHSLHKIPNVTDQQDGLGDTQNNQYLWDGDHFTEGRQIRIGSKDDYPIALSDGGRYALLQSDIETLSLWDLEQETPVANICPVLMPQYDHVACSDDSNHLVLAGSTGYLQYWDVSKGHLVSHVSTDGIIHAIAFSPENYLAISQKIYQPSLFSSREMSSFSSWVDFRGDIPFQLCDIHSGKCLQVLEGHSGRTNTIVFSHDGKKMATNQDSGVFYSWNLETGDLIYTKKIQCAGAHDHIFYVASIGWLWGRRNACKLWTRTTRKTRSVVHPERVTSAAFSPDEKNFVTGCVDANVRIYDTDCNLLRLLQGHEKAITMLKFSPKENKLVSTSEDRTIRLWDIETGNCLRVFTGHNNSVIHASFTQNGQQIISVSQDGTIRLWSIETGEELARCYGFDDGNWAVVAPDGRYDSSNNGDCSYLRWTVGMNSFPVAKFKDKFYMPGLLSQLQGNDTSSQHNDIDEVKQYWRSKLLGMI